MRKLDGRLLGAAAAVLVSVGLALLGAEVVLRFRFPETPWTPGPQAEAIEAALVPHPTLGFLWKPNLRWEENVRLPWADQEVQPLVTDGEGFRNAPAAIRARTAGARTDILGIGDSFVHDAAYVWHEAFARHRLAYYSRAMHRYSPPQYNVALRLYGLPLHPRAVVYGVYENDFLEAMDYEDWTRSGLDWFTFHSGTWSGPPGNPDAVERWFQRHVRGIYALYRSAAAGRRRDAALARRKREIPSGVASYVLEARRLCSAQGVPFLVVLIPFKPRGEPPRFENPAYDALASRLRESGVTVLDLRPTFAAQAAPRSLFYRVDAHWNRRGMLLAAEAIVAALTGSGAPGDGPPAAPASAAPRP